MWIFAQAMLDPVSIFAAACVALYAWERFHTPKPVRSTTTRARYLVALTGYVFVELTIFFVLAWILHENPHAASAVKSLIGTELPVGEVPPELQKVFSQFHDQELDQHGKSAAIAALILTVVFPKIPFLNKPYGMIKKWFRELGMIPGQASKVRRMLRRAHFAVPAEFEQTLVQELSRMNIEPDTFVGAPAKSVEAMWVQIVVLMAKARETISDNANFCKEQESLFSEILEAYENEKELAKIVHIAKEDDSIINVFRDRWSSLLEKINMFISCGLLQTTSSMSSLMVSASKWGYSNIQKERAALKLDDYAMVVIICFLCFLFYFIAIIQPDVSVPKSLYLALTISLIIGSSIACAVYPKKFFGTPNAKDIIRRPWFLYMSSGAFAAVCWFGIHTALMLIEGSTDPSLIVDRIEERIPWVLMPISTGIAFAFLCDNAETTYPRTHQKHKWLVGWTEGGFMALSYAMTSFVVVRWFASGPATGSEDYQTMFRLASERPEYVIGFTAVIGFVLGMIVPSLYRRAQRRKQAPTGIAALPGERRSMPAQTAHPPLRAAHNN